MVRAHPAADSPTVLVVGTGAAARHLASALHGAGASVLLWGRGRDRARRLAGRLGVRHAPDRRAALARLGPRDTVLLCVADPALEAVADELARERRGAGGGPVLLHVSGSRGPEVLAAAAPRFHGTGSLHPLVALAGRASSRGLAGRWVALAGDAPARRRAARLARSLGARTLSLAPDGDRVRYHAAAALLATGLVALHEAARSVLAGELEDPRAAGPALCGLASSVLGNLSRLGAAEALTGPVARGDAGTVRRHLASLEGHPAALELYRVLARSALGLTSHPDLLAGPDPAPTHRPAP